MAGAFSVNGTVSTTGQTVSCNVTVEAAKAVSAKAAEVSTPAGVAPKLPSTVEVTWDDGTATLESVTWSGVDAGSYAQPGSFDVKGTTAGMSVTAHVNVTAAEVVQTGDETASPVLLAMVAADGLLAALAGLIPRLQAKRP